jgi:hypothetical protein
MFELKEILKQKQIKLASIEASKSRKGGNPYWNEAKQLAEYLGISTPFVLKLFNRFGKNKVIALKSYLKDFPADKRGLYGIMVWKLKQAQNRY